MDKITWQEFQKVETRVGTIIRAENFPEAKKPAYILTIDFGDYGIKKSSAQITDIYKIDELEGKQVVCIINFPPKQIGPIMSEVLVTGFPNESGHVVLAIPDKHVPNGSRLF